MSALIAALAQVAELLERVIGTDVLASLAGLAIIVLFLYAEGGHRSRHSH